MPNFFPIRNAINPKGETFGWDEAEPNTTEVAGWLEKASIESPKDDAGKADWFEKIISGIDLKNLKEEDLKQLATNLKDAFSKGIDDYSIVDPNGVYMQCIGEARESTDPHEIIALICNAVLMHKNPDRLTDIPVPPEDAALFKGLRDAVAKHKESHLERENSSPDVNIAASEKIEANSGNIHREPQRKPKEPGAIPSIEEFLHWADELGFSKGVRGLTSASASNQQILVGLKQAFRDSFLVVASSYDDPEIKKLMEKLLTTVGELPQSSEKKKSKDAKEAESKQLGNPEMSMEARIATLLQTTIAIRARIEVLNTPQVGLTEQKSKFFMPRENKPVQRQGGARTVRGLDLSKSEEKLLKKNSSDRSSSSDGENTSPPDTNKKGRFGKWQG